MKDPDPLLGILLGIAAVAVVIVAACIVFSTDVERTNMLDKLPTKNTHSTGVNWR